MYLDCSIVVHDRTKAEALCRQYNERAYYDLAGGTDVYVKAIEKGRGDEEAALRASDIPERRDATTDGERDTRSGGFASPGDRESPDIGELASKFNPYHDQLGRFTSGPGGHGTTLTAPPMRAPTRAEFEQMAKLARSAREQGIADRVSLETGSREHAEEAIRVAAEVSKNAKMEPLDEFSVAGTTARYYHEPGSGGIVQVPASAMAVEIAMSDELKDRLGKAERLAQQGDAEAKRVLERLHQQQEAVQSGRHDVYYEHSAFAFASPIEACVRHEMGHAWHDQNRTAVKDHTAVKDFFRAPNWDSGPKNWARDFGITERAKDDWHECIAENFALYSAGKIERMHPVMVAFFRQHTDWAWPEPGEAGWVGEPWYVGVKRRQKRRKEVNGE